MRQGNQTREISRIAGLAGPVQNGMLRGVVVANNDPMGIGRIKVRVPQIHGAAENGIPDDKLPWTTSTMAFGGHDSGSSIVPEVGSSGIVGFENSDRTKPIFVGCTPQTGRTDVGEVGDTDGNRRYRKGKASDLPTEVETEGMIHDPSIKVVYKSPKGAGLFIDDRNGFESITIKDAAGQVLKLSTPMKGEYTKNGGHKDSFDMHQRHFTHDVLMEENVMGKSTLSFASTGKTGFMFSADKKTGAFTVGVQPGELKSEEGQTLPPKIAGFDMAADDEGPKVLFQTNNAGNRMGFQMKGSQIGIFTDKGYVLVDDDFVQVSANKRVSVLATEAVIIEANNIVLSGDRIHLDSNYVTCRAADIVFGEGGGVGDKESDSEPLKPKQFVIARSRDSAV